MASHWQDCPAVTVNIFEKCTQRIFFRIAVFLEIIPFFQDATDNSKIRMLSRNY